MGNDLASQPLGDAADSLSSTSACLFGFSTFAPSPLHGSLLKPCQLGSSIVNLLEAGKQREPFPSPGIVPVGGLTLTGGGLRERSGAPTRLTRRAPRTPRLSRRRPPPLPPCPKAEPQGWACAPDAHSPDAAGGRRTSSSSCGPSPPRRLGSTRARGRAGLIARGAGTGRGPPR